MLKGTVGPRRHSSGLDGRYHRNVYIREGGRMQDRIVTSGSVSG